MDTATKEKVTRLVKDATVTTTDEKADRPSGQDVLNEAIITDAAGIYEYLNVDGSNLKALDYANEIYKWAKESATSDDKLDILWAVKDLRNKMGSPSFGTSELAHLYRYVKLVSKKRTIEKEIDLLIN